jgi:hypothetical protein
MVVDLDKLHHQEKMVVMMVLKLDEVEMVMVAN